MRGVLRGKLVGSVIVLALALILTVSYMTSSETCRFNYDGIRLLDGSTKPGSPPVSTTCSRHFWW